MVGVDIDSTLIAAAWKRRRYVWSLSTTPPPASVAASTSSNKKRKRKEVEASERETQSAIEDSWSYFPTSMQHLFGPLVIPPPPPLSETGEAIGFPYNVSFRTEDWLTSELRVEEYDVILAFVELISRYPIDADIFPT